ncbi:MAG: TonB-dependent receptor [Bacteroidales bacterium]|nr:TonB-dependent receptor [Bacteroidales bacterium]
MRADLLHSHGAALRFRRFCRRGWAVLATLHREVTIGHLAARVADSSMAKGGVAVVAGVLLMQGPLLAQSDEGREGHTLPEVTISVVADSLTSTTEPAAVLTASDFNQSSIHTIADLVAQLPGVDLRLRGGGDVQGDLSMRGGTFDQMLVLLNGVDLTDAQTGHLTLDIPIDITMVERVELLTPADCLARGLSAFCGAVNLVVCDTYRDRLLAEVRGGSYGTLDAALLAGTTTGAWALTTAAAVHRSDGYRTNTDYGHGSLMLQALRHGENSDWHLQVGGQTKSYGGAGFYSSRYPDQYESTKTLTASVSNQWRLQRFTLHVAAYGRMHRDHFELFRDGYVDSVPAWYGGHNEHLSRLGGVTLRGMMPLWRGVVTAGAGLRHESIWSTVLGEEDSTLSGPYDHAGSRTALTMHGGYRVRLGRLTAEGTLLGRYSDRFGGDYGWAAQLQYRVLKVVVARTFRQPTFTDLYYRSVTQVPNAALGAESSTTVEATLSSAYRWRRSDLRLSATGYYRAGDDIIDWVRREDEEVWYSMNHTEVDAMGVDVSGSWTLAPFVVRMSYSLCHVAADAGSWISAYALDYLRHKAVVNIGLRLSDFSIHLGASYRYRDGEYVEGDEVRRYGGVVLCEARMDYRIGHVTLFMEGHNLLDRVWRDHGGVPQAGVTASGGVRVEI